MCFRIYSFRLVCCHTWRFHLNNLFLVGDETIILFYWDAGFIGFSLNLVSIIFRRNICFFGGFIDSFFVYKLITELKAFCTLVKLI